MTKDQFQREQILLARAEHLRQARANQLELLASAQASAAPVYVIGAAGYWLQRWQGTPHPTRGTKWTKGRTGRKKKCPTTILSSTPAASLAFCLST